MANIKLEQLIKQLVGLSSGWDDDDNRKLYVDKLIPDLQAGRLHNATERERTLIAEIQRVADEDEWVLLPDLIDECAKRLVQHRRRDSDRAIVERGERRRRQDVDRILVRVNAAARERLREMEEEEEARQIRRQRVQAEEAAKETERQRRALEKQRESIRIALKSALKDSVAEADKLNAKINVHKIVDYAEIKAAYIAKWAKRYLAGYSLEREQIDAIGQMPPASLLKARAGSGKTTTITARARFLLEHERVPPDQLMILAFNRKAADEVARKLRQKGTVIEFNNARTFHSLAYQLVQPKTDLLYDKSTGSTKKQSEFVQRLIRKVLNPALLAKIYIFFRQEMKELDDIGAFLSDDEYYVYRRNEVQDALGGQHVKSTGEKWLADFLFEHGVYYEYERIWYWDDGSRRNYCPDFSITVDRGIRDIVIEHWGIDLSDPAQKVPDHWNQTWQDYRKEIDRKRAFWKRYNENHPDDKVRFLETSIIDLRHGREAFEERLATILADAGIRLRRLPDEELHKKVETSRIGRFSTMCLQYIQKAKKQRLSPEDMAERIATTTHRDLKTRAFLDIANNIYDRYQKALVKENKTDFDDLIIAAIDLVRREKGNCQIPLKDDRVVAMNELRWIMVDEYQDFSELFYDLVDAIRTYNESAKLFCVGDDWQAINAFAGSDLQFFEGFEASFEGAEIGYLQNNYRSAPELVDVANSFMSGQGKGSIATRRDLTGSLHMWYTEKVWIQQRSGDEFAEERAKDDRFRTSIDNKGEKRPVDGGLRIARILKQCHSILTSDRYESDTKFAILSRKERLGMAYPNLQAFHRKLRRTLLPGEKEAFGDFDARVHCGTVHSYKGLEADVVIVLDVNDRNFPKIHPDNVLYAIFGVTPKDVLAEEERLFYVAITRAKRDLYLLTETGRESEYIDRLELPQAAARWG